MPKAMDNAALWYPWFKPLVQSSAGRVGIALGLVAVSGKSIFMTDIDNPYCRFIRAPH